MSRGYLFIWVEKQMTSEVMDIFESKNFAYVENMAWIRLLPTNRLMMEPAPYFARSKLTMLIFKKVCEATKNLDLRHQRSCDVWMDFVRHRTTTDGREDKPSYQYHLIETMLPSIPPLRKLQLWAPPHRPRTGWTMLSQEFSVQPEEEGQLLP